MKITDEAAKLLSKIMKKTGLNPKEYFLSLDIIKNQLSINFTKLKYGYRKLQLQDLIIVLQKEIDVTIDCCEVEGKNGLVFRENNGN